jgi:hypothetical protein
MKTENFSMKNGLERRKEMKSTLTRTLAFTACLVALFTLAAPCFAGSYQNSGSIHMPTAVYLASGGSFPNEAMRIHQLFITNRCDHPITASIDFYDADGVEVVSGVSAGAISGHAVSQINTYNLSELAPYAGERLSCVVKWSGQVDAAPMVSLGVIRLDGGNNLTGYELYVNYDDAN